MRRALALFFLASLPIALHGRHQSEIKPQVIHPEFKVQEATIPEMQAAMREGRVTSRGLVVQYLIRIALYNNQLNRIITVNPHALGRGRSARSRTCPGQDSRPAARHSDRA